MEKYAMIFDPKDSDEETATKFMEWLRNNKPHEILDRGTQKEEKNILR